MFFWIIPLLGLVILEATADYFSGGFGHSGKFSFAVFALIFYILANVSWLVAIRNGVGLTRGAALFSVLSTVLAVFIGYFIYKESINTYQVFGLLLGAVSIFLLLK